MRFASAETLIRRARAATGLEDFGPGDWRDGLDRLTGALAGKHFHEAGQAGLEGRFVGLLSARLRIEDWLRRHPEDGDGEIDGPLVILGLPRTATSALQNLLADDPRWRFVRGWESREPVPPPDLTTEADDPRALAEIARMAADRTYAGKHLQRAGGPVDDAALHQMCFHNQDLAFGVPDYTRWWRGSDMSDTYRYQARMLRLLQRRRPPNRWMIKAPWHNFHLNALVAAFPTARFVMTHRDPAKVIPSLASLLETAQRTLYPAEAIDKKAIGRFLVEHLQISVTRLIEFRSRQDDSRFLDLDHGAFNADPMREMGRLYGWVGLPLGPAAAGFEQWAAANRKGVHGEHRYAPEEFGVSAAEIRDAFRPYMQHFRVGET